MTDTAVDFLLENLMQLMNCNVQLLPFEKEEIESLFEEMQFFRVFLMDTEEERDEHEKVKDLVEKIRDVSCEVENIIDWFVLIGVTLNGLFVDSLGRDYQEIKIKPPWRVFFAVIGEEISTLGSSYSERLTTVIEEIESHMPEKYQELCSVREEIKSIKTEVMEIYEMNTYGIGVQGSGESSLRSSARASRPMVEEEIVVGFDEERAAIIEQLTGELEKQLKVIPIIGMPGIGKTTLAIKVYNDPFIVYHFYIRAWTYVSQVYQKRDLFFSILYSAFQLRDEISNMSDEKLGEELYKRLKGKRYLIVVDDIWNFRAWDDLKRYFPNDKNGSRIIFTSRHVDVAVALHAKPHFLRFLNEDESWDLLQQKVFGKESCSDHELMEIGKQIAKKCQGLPLAILVVSGLLAKKDKTKDWWRLVAESVSSYISSDQEQYMGTLALSYKYLPHYLKACFLYFGAFPEDYEISVRSLTWLWIAEGFVRQNEHKSLEEVAEDYLIDLIDRSLVIVSKKRSNGGIKACRIHDLLRDLCLLKAQEEKFLQQVSRYDLTSYEQTCSLSPPPSASSSLKRRRMCIHSNLVDYTSLRLCLPNALHIRSFMSFGFDNKKELGVLFVCRTFKLLRVLDVSSIIIHDFPEEIQQLVHLRYLALHIGKSCFKPSISNLWNLETLIFEGEPFEHIELPHGIWEMVKLRHLCTKRSITLPCVPSDSAELWPLSSAESTETPRLLGNLQTLSTQYICDGDEQILASIPNLRKLKFVSDHFPKLDFLIHLETLNVSYEESNAGPVRSPHLKNFPPNLRKLTLSNFCLHWQKMSTLGRLPNLEVLKLYKAFKGRRWNTSDGGFAKLRYLKFEGLDIKQWNASDIHFPSLQTLVLEDCRLLEEVPFGLGDISTLEMIQLLYCSHSAENSARQIQKCQQDNGNDGLKIVIHPWDHDLMVLEDDFAKIGF